MPPSHASEDTLPGPPFFQRYGVNLPSSLTEGRSLTWGDFPLPTCVGLRYGQTHFSLAAFLDGLGTDDFHPLSETRPSGHVDEIGTSLDLTLPTGNRPCPFGRLTFPIASPLHSNDLVWCRNIQPAFHRLRL